MAKGRFLNQKLGKVTGRRQGMLKAQLTADRRLPPQDAGRARKKGISREPRPAR
jgi:hypothetical protein